MRISTIAMVFTLAGAGALSAQQDDAMARAEATGVCGPAGVAEARYLPDGRIAVQCNTGAAAADQTAGGPPATGFAPLLGPAFGVIGLAALAGLDGGSSTSDTQ
ncbi:hypothetical protein DRV85_03520 [Rhodosalinus halophilus]|uniref:Uncharacterized protein n=1 Tax=Rhodosalinus halophilus TaxID=2259333 RepID=A0A365UER4_9RHOB|nr:hypothetical protein [Rhodosalinus halophilus]RBI87204.1 hypothetical protein DRV85_03520 [Rhodosalinus halophilus]